MTQKLLRQIQVFGLFTMLALASFGLESRGAVAQSAATPEAATATPVPASPPLSLLWQTSFLHNGVLIDPNFITVDDQGNAYVSDANGFPVKKFDANGNFLVAFGRTGTGDGQFTFETGLAVDAQGNLYVADFEGTRIEKFDQSGNFLTKWSTEDPVGPVGLGVDSKGNVYVGNHRTHDHYIQKFDSTGHLLTEWGSNGSDDGQFAAGPTSGIEDLVVDKQDNIYVTDPLNHRIQKFDSNGNFLAQFGVYGGDQFDRPFTVAVDAQGNIYLNDGRFLQKLNPDGKFLAQWSTGPQAGGDLDRTNRIAVDAQGDIYAIAYANVMTPKNLMVDILVLKKFRQP